MDTREITHRNTTFTAEGVSLGLGMFVQAKRVTIAEAQEGKKPHRYDGGIIHVTNAAFAEETHGATTSAILTSIYDLDRAIRHITLGYGVRFPSEFSERDDLGLRVADLREIVAGVKRGSNLDEEQRQSFGARLLADVSSRFAERDEDKVEASASILRALVLRKEDATGRENPGAAAMLIGTAIGHLLTRAQQVAPGIDAFIAMRDVQVSYYIEQHVRWFKGVRALVRPAIANARAESLWGWIDRIKHPVVPNDPTDAWEALRKHLGRIHEESQQIIVNPCRRNVWHLRLDVEEAMTAFDRHDVDAFAKIVERMHNGTRFFFAGDYFHENVLNPFALVIHREHRRFLSEGRKQRGTRRRFKDHLAAIDWSWLPGRISQFEAGLANLTDKNLRKPVLDRIRAHLTLAREELGKHRIKQVKDHFLAVAGII